MIPEVKEIENDASGDLKSSRSDQDDAGDDRDNDHDDGDRNADNGDHNNDGFNSICVPGRRWQR